MKNHSLKSVMKEEYNKNETRPYSTLHYRLHIQEDHIFLRLLVDCTRILFTGTFIKIIPMKDFVEEK